MMPSYPRLTSAQVSGKTVYFGNADGAVDYFTKLGFPAPLFAFHTVHVNTARRHALQVQQPRRLLHAPHQRGL